MFRLNLTDTMKADGFWRGPEDPFCPYYCCPDEPKANFPARTECKRTMGQNGHAINVDEEMMLVFGGIVNRQRSFKDNETGDVYDIFNYCEDFTRINRSDSLPYFLKTCGEELVRDVWTYNIKYDFWSWMKPDYNGDIYLYVKQPYARYGHAGTYVEL